jgi:hypothetical protein
VHRFAFSAFVFALLLGACGGAEFSAVNGDGAAAAGSGGGAAGETAGASGNAGSALGAGGSGDASDASASGGAGGQTASDAAPPRDVSSGAGGTGSTFVDARADVGPPDTGATPTCPSVEPVLLGPCSSALKCTYGTHPRLSCRSTYTCSSGQWSLGSTPCPDLGLCTSEAELPFIGKTCAATGHDCIWDSGLYCRCLACPGMGCPEWSCSAPPSGCKATPVNLGQPCDPTAPATCDYGACSLGTKVTVTCVNGFTTWTFPNCQ